MAAQRDIIKRELDDLASPVARERTEAVLRLAALEGDIAADLRVAYKFSDEPERIGLLEVARIRSDEALVQQGAEALVAENETLRAEARDYLLKLPFGALQPDVAVFDANQQTAWNEFLTFRFRRDISLSLIDAHLLPGKFFGQFEALRRYDTARLDRELLAILAADAGFAEALNLAATETLQREIPAERAFQTPWRRLQSAGSAFAPALAYLQGMERTDAVNRGVVLHGRAAWFAALEVACGIRCAAARALADSPQGAELAGLLDAYYNRLLAQVPDGEVQNLIHLEELRTEIELTLSRYGDDRLLRARIEALRTQIQRVQEAQTNVNMAVATRPDLIAQNQIAHLLLRDGDAEGAEAEWKAAVETGLEMLKAADGRNRSSLSSYLAAVYYNLSCAQSLQLKLTKGLASLREAVRHGYKDFGWMLEDGDLEALRAGDAFRDWFLDSAPPGIADRLGSRR